MSRRTVAMLPVGYNHCSEPKKLERERALGASIPSTLPRLADQDHERQNSVAEGGLGRDDHAPDQRKIWSTTLPRRRRTRLDLSRAWGGRKSGDGVHLKAAPDGAEDTGRIELRCLAAAGVAATQLTIRTAASKRFDAYSRPITHDGQHIPDCRNRLFKCNERYRNFAHASERTLPLAKPTAIPLHSVAANRTSLTAIYVDRRDTGLIRHVDFQDVPSPNLAKIAFFGNKNLMKAAVRRTKSISIETLDLVEVDCDKLHAFLFFQVAQEARPNVYCVASAQ